MASRDHALQIGCVLLSVPDGLAHASAREGLLDVALREGLLPATIARAGVRAVLHPLAGQPAAARGVLDELLDHGSRGSLPT
jgi:hypothetical protein